MQGLLICTVFLAIWKALDKVVEMYNLYLSAKVNMKEIESRKGEDPDPQAPADCDIRHIGFAYRTEEEYEEDE